MHFLTKFLVAVAAVLSVALASLTIAYSVNADRIVGDLQSERAAKDRAVAEKQAQVAELSQRLDALEESLRQRTEAYNRERDRVRDLRAQASDLEGQIREAEAARRAAENTVVQVGRTSETLGELLSAQRDELSSLRQSEMRFRRDQLDLTERLNDVESARESLAQTVRALREQIAEMQRALATAGREAPDRRPRLEEMGEPIEALTRFSGRVEEIGEDPSTGEMLVRVNVGSNDDVTENMKLFVTRGNDWVANIVVTSTDLDFSVGVVRLTAPEKSVNTGDRVVSRLQ